MRKHLHCDWALNLSAWTDFTHRFLIFALFTYSLLIWSGETPTNSYSCNQSVCFYKTLLSKNSNTLRFIISKENCLIIKKNKTQLHKKLIPLPFSLFFLSLSFSSWNFLPLQLLFFLIFYFIIHLRNKMINIIRDTYSLVTWNIWPLHGRINLQNSFSLFSLRIKELRK